MYTGSPVPLLSAPAYISSGSPSGTNTSPSQACGRDELCMSSLDLFRQFLRGAGLTKVEPRPVVDIRGGH